MAEDEKTNGNGNIVIRARDVYEVVLKLRDDVRDLVSQKKTVEDHEGRLRKLEYRWYAIIAGIVSAVGVVVYQAVR